MRLISRFSKHEYILVFVVLIVTVVYPRIILANESLLTKNAQPVVGTLELIPPYGFSRPPVCQLNLVLTGTLSGNTKKALIRVDGRNEELFITGQIITENVFLEDVGLQSALISHDGELERLELVTDNGLHQKELAPLKSTRSVIAAVIPRTSDTIDNPASPDPTPRQENKQPDKTHSYLGIQFEYADFLTQAKITPDATGGLNISETVPGGLYQQFGLQDGDNVRAINDHSVNSINDLVSWIRKKDGTETIKISFMRYGNLYDLNLDPEHGISSSMVIDPKELK